MFEINETRLLEWVQEVLDEYEFNKESWCKMVDALGDNGYDTSKMSDLDIIINYLKMP